jgi:hypothetical protein
MKYLKMVLVLLALTALFGCETAPRQPPQWRNVFIKPSAALTKDCPVSPPPSKAAFMKMTADERVEVLSKYSVALLGNLGNCNEQWASYRKWQDEQEKIHTKDNPK